MLADKDNTVRRIAVQSVLPALLSAMRTRPELAALARQLLQHTLQMESSGHDGVILLRAVVWSNDACHPVLRDEAKSDYLSSSTNT
jgi:hypothetical protein